MDGSATRTKINFDPRHEKPTNFASSEIDTETTAASTFVALPSELAESVVDSTLPPDRKVGDQHLEKASSTRAAIECCKVVQKMSGPLEDSKWTKRGEAILVASLPLVDACEKDPSCIPGICLLIKEERGGRRAPKASNLELLGVQMCCSSKTEAEQKDLSRFAKVVKLARLENVTPANAAEWLALRKFSEMLSAYAKYKSGGTKAKVENPIKKKAYPNLHAALFNGSGAAHDRARAELERALKAVDALLAPGEQDNGQGA